MERNEIGKGFFNSPSIAADLRSKSTEAVSERFGTGVPMKLLTKNALGRRFLVTTK
jgi:hypothetical protein